MLRHWQYHSVQPSGFEEFSCGALDDENAIRGEKPGGFKSTDPEGLVDQRFLYSEPTGGFPQVTIGEAPGTLSLSFVADEGKVLYETLKSLP